MTREQTIEVGQWYSAHWGAPYGWRQALRGTPEYTWNVWAVWIMQQDYIELMACLERLVRGGETEAPSLARIKGSLYQHRLDNVRPPPPVDDPILPEDFPALFGGLAEKFGSGE